MRTIQFNKDNIKDTVRTTDKPVVNIISAVFNSSDSDWIQRLFSTALTLKASCYDSADKLVCYSSQIVMLGTYITPYHKQPIIDINYTEHFQIQSLSYLKRQSYWTTEIILEDIQFRENESLNVSVLERRHIQARVEDWKTRINTLYTEIQSWLANQPDYSCAIAHPTVMDENLMRAFEIPPQNINSLDVSYKGKIVLAL
jgi:hypothetical protein